MPASEIDDRDRPSPDRKLPPEPPIHRAARRGAVADLERLLALGGDINEPADLEFDNGPHLCGLTPLMLAARSIDGATTQTLRWLVDHGADLHATSKGGNTAAWYAAGHGGRWDFHKKAVTPDHVQRLRYLLDAGLDVHERNFIGRSLITEAAEAGDPARVALVLERGANPTPDNPVASKSSRLTDFAELLNAPELAHADTDLHRGQLRPFEIPLFCAARSGSAECVQLLLDAGSSASERDSSGATALAVTGSASAATLLVEAGADISAIDEFGKDAFQTILEEGCCGGACGPERFQILDALIQAGVDIERRDQYGKTRVASAAFGHHGDAVVYLLDRGANVHALDSEQGTALHSICWQGEYADPAVNDACRNIIEALANAGGDLDATDCCGMTPMHPAAGGDWGNPTAIRSLLRLGAETDLRDNHGNTPLLLAAYSGEVECIRLLLAAGVDPQTKNSAGETARDIARAHLSTWESIVADGAEEVDAAIQEVHEAAAKRMADLLGGAIQLPNVDTEEDTVARHQESLAQARAAFALIERSLQERLSE